jgi:hypothetical protein
MEDLDLVWVDPGRHDIMRETSVVRTQHLLLEGN